MPETKGVIDRLLEELTKLPGIGPKSAVRIARFSSPGDRPQCAYPCAEAAASGGRLGFDRAASASTSRTATSARSAPTRAAIRECFVWSKLRAT